MAFARFLSWMLHLTSFLQLTINLAIATAQSSNDPDHLHTFDESDHAQLYARRVPGDYYDEMDSVVRPLVRVEHHHIMRRDNQHDIFRPQKEITLDYQYRDGKIQTFNFEHEHDVYVNLEPLQSHGLLDHRRPLCVETHPSNKSNLHLDFKHADSYKMAKQQWQGPLGEQGLLFVVEDSSCHENEGIRSVYRAEDIAFDDNASSIQITAQHKRFGPTERETAKKVNIHVGSLEKLKKRHVNSKFYVASRIKRGLNTSPFLDDPLFSEVGDDPIDEIKDKFDHIPGVDEDDPVGDIKDKVDAIDELGRDKIHDILQELEKALSFNFNKTLNIDVDKNFDGEFGAEESRKEITKDPKKFLPLPTITLIDTFANINLDFTVGVSFNIMGETDKFLDGSTEDGVKSVFDDALQDLFIEVETKEDLRMNLQAEIAAKAGPFARCSVWLYPNLGQLSCAAAFTTAGPLINIPHVKLPRPHKTADNSEASKDEETKKSKMRWTDPDKSAFGVAGFGMGFGAGIALWTSLDLSTTLNITTPGINITVPKGQVAGYGRKGGEKFQEKFDGTIDWSPPKFHTQDSTAKFGIGIGPNLEVSYGIGQSQRESKQPGPGEAPIKHTLAFDLYARIDTPAIDVSAGTVSNVNEKCEAPGKKDGGSQALSIRESAGKFFERAFQFAIDLKVGFIGGITLPLGINVDTTSIQTGVKGMEGLQYKVDIWKHCWDITNTALGQWELGKFGKEIAQKLGKERKSVGDAVFDYEKAETATQKPTEKPTSPGTTTRSKRPPQSFPTDSGPAPQPIKKLTTDTSSPSTDDFEYVWPSDPSTTTRSKRPPQSFPTDDSSPAPRPIKKLTTDTSSPSTDDFEFIWPSKMEFVAKRDGAPGTTIRSKRSRKSFPTDNSRPAPRPIIRLTTTTSSPSTDDFEFIWPSKMEFI